MRLLSFKKPANVLLVTQLFSMISYAVLYSNLVLFMTQSLDFSVTKANAVMGVFVAFNYGLHILGGYMGGRLVSYRVLFLIGMVFQVIACVILMTPTSMHLYIALALFLTGAGLNAPCVNMMLTQQFKPDDAARETAFFWNYAAMNGGFFLGFMLAGVFQNSQAYDTLFLITTIANIIAFFLILLGWKAVADHTTPLTEIVKKRGKQVLYCRNICGLLVTLAVFAVLIIALQYPMNTDSIVLLLGIALLLIFLPIARAQKGKREKNRVYAYFILSLFGLVFWVPYSLAPMALTIFTQHNVDRVVAGFSIPTEWFQNINTSVLIVGGLLLPMLLAKVRKKRFISFPLQFVLSLLSIAVGFLMLPIGIALADKAGYSAMIWLVLSYFFQSIGELFIGPTGYAMIGKLATPKLQGLMMGSWMVVTGGTSGVIASLLSIWVSPDMTTATPVATNPAYNELFIILMSMAFICAGVLYFLVPKLHALIGFKK